MKNVGIIGIGRYLPVKVMTNKDMESFVDTSDEWIRTRTGIEERRIANETESTSYMAIESAKEALLDANLEAKDIDMIIVATVTPTHHFPSVACEVQHAIGARNVPSFDVAAACSGFMYAMSIAKPLIETGVHKHILIVGAEKLSTMMDFNDRTTCVLFGDGAGAVVLSEVSEGKGILSYELGADGSGGISLYDDRTTGFINMNGREVFKFAVRQMGDSAVRVLEKAGYTKDDVNFLIPHQANIRIMESSRERLELPKEKMSVTVNKFGNTSSASIPLSLYEEVKTNKIHDNDLVVLVGFGGGLTWGAICLKWGR